MELIRFSIMNKSLAREALARVLDHRDRQGWKSSYIWQRCSEVRQWNRQYSLIVTDPFAKDFRERAPIRVAWIPKDPKGICSFSISDKVHYWKYFFFFFSLHKKSLWERGYTHNVCKNFINYALQCMGLDQIYWNRIIWKSGA